MSCLHEYDIVCLQETCHRSADQLLPYFPGYEIHHQPAPRHVRGLGMATLVHRKLARGYRVVSSPNPVLQMTAVALQHPLVPEPLMVINCYVPPTGSPQFEQLNMLDWYQHLQLFCCQAHEPAAHGLLLVGDFNAHISLGQDEPVGHNTSGRLLVDMAATCDLQFMLMHSDATPPTFHTMRGGSLATSSPDHVLASIEMVADIQAEVRTDVLGSDHRPLSVVLRWPGVHEGGEPLPLLPHFPIVRWKQSGHAYVVQLAQRIARGDMEAVQLAVQDGLIDAAMDTFQEVLLFSAIAAGHDLCRRAPTTCRPLPAPNGSKPWFTAECRQLRQHYHQVLRRCGHAQPEVVLAAHAYHTRCRCLKRQWAKDVVDDLIQQAIHHPRLFWKHFKSKLPSAPYVACAADANACIAFLTDLLHRPHLPASDQPPGHLSDANDHVMNIPVSTDEVARALSSLRNNVAAGCDGLPAEFYKHACTRDNNSRPLEHLLLEYLVLLFNHFFSRGQLPQKWGTSLITLVFKKGDKSNWAHYRPLAVTLVIAKIYALILNARLTQWAEAAHIHNPAQAGFRAGHSTVFNNFVLLHIIHKHKHEGKPLFVCYLDIKKAYDSVIRSHVWQRLYELGVRGRILFAIAAFYQRVVYIVKFHNGTSPPFAANVGLRQGCPLSPFLFSVIIQLMHDCIVSDRPHAGPTLQTSEEGALRVPCLFYADDSAQLEDSAVQTQMALHSTAVFCDREDFDLSMDKTKVVVYNAAFQSATDRSIVFRFRDRTVQRATEYVFLGLLTKQRHTAAGMVHSAARKGQAAISVVYRKLHALGAQANAEILLRLFDSVVMPNLTFGCEVWGPWILHCPGGELSHTAWLVSFHEHASQTLVDQVRLSFARTLLALPSRTPIWNILRELGWYPLQVYVARQLVRFMNRLWAMPRATLARQAMLEAWRCFFAGCRDGWCARVHDFLHKAGIPPVGFLPDDNRVPVYDEWVVHNTLRVFCHQAYLAPNLPSKMAAYHADFGSVIDVGAMRRGWARPAYMALPLPLRKLRLLTRFRLSCHHLAVETGRWAGVDIDQRVCTLCRNGAVQDEHHILFFCHALDNVRTKYPLLFGGRFTHVRQMFDFSQLHDWKNVARDLCRFLDEVGGVYQPLAGILPVA